MQFFRRIVIYGLAFIALLGLVLTRSSLTAPTIHWYLVLAGIALVVVPAGIIFLLYRREANAESSTITQWIERLKVEGLKIPVDLTQCEVKSNAWTSDEERYSSARVSFLNSVSGDPEKNVIHVQSNVSRICYKTMVQGSDRVFFSPAIEKDRVALLMLLEMKGSTYVYVDRDSPDEYYFDLEFLNA